MTDAQKRELLKAFYPNSEKWAARVKFMPRSQVHMILLRLQSQEITQKAA